MNDARTAQGAEDGALTSGSAPAPVPLADDDVVLVAAVRTPMGRRRGALADRSAVDLGVLAVRGALDAVPSVREDVAQVVVGNVIQAGSGQNVARQVSLGAGLAHDVPATTVNEVCGSGLKAVVLGAQLIQLGRAEVVVAAGTESMTRAPLVSAYDDGTRSYGEPRPSLMTDALEDAFTGTPMGLTAEEVSQRWGVDRASQDAWALVSQQRAAAATEDGVFDAEIVPVALTNGTVMTADEPIRGGSTAEGIAALSPVFSEDGVVTAANASPVTDGASAVVLASAAYARAHGLPVLARLTDYEEIAIDPAVMGIAPRFAIPALLERTGHAVGDVDSWEINEAFAVTTVAATRELGLDPARVNPDGGAIALGHPLGSTGVRLLVTLAHRMVREGESRGVASLCVGGGLGLAALLERPAGLGKESAAAEASTSTTAPSGGTSVPFYRLSPAGRRERLVDDGVLSPADAEVLASPLGLAPDTAAGLIENQVGQTHLPLGVLPGLVVDGRSWTVPMTTEEASVVAAASNGARIVRGAGGFRTQVPGRLMIGQVVLVNPVAADLPRTISALGPEIDEAAAKAYPSILKRGGGLRDVRVREVAGPVGPDGSGSDDDGDGPRARSFVCLDLLVDVRDAQGANIVDAIAEAVAALLRERLPREEVLMAIISNDATESLVTVSCDVPAHLLVSRRDAAAAGVGAESGPSANSAEGRAVLEGLGAEQARRIALASDLAQVDVHRAVTHNKGVMNGVHAVVLAVGNDTRAIEAGCHAWAARDGRYRGLSQWSTRTGEDGGVVLHGEMTLPLPMATVGGSSRALPEARAALGLLGADSAVDLARVAAATGLAQNLTAVRALVTDGIQRGHMNLQARALAMAVGATGARIEAVAEGLRHAERMNEETARAILAGLG
ncbi:acetyl-CoA C-acyltransferase [Actinomyces haliotis]|uniref:acetyl-CoA C-acyltransferase n=1 Tax=Actinomyces haliotis TaxID=1280843 RepID=UPI00188ED424|nr:acetyl-CoA C-acyltransferase [Actinomyces haliotis]